MSDFGEQAPGMRRSRSMIDKQARLLVGDSAFVCQIIDLSLSGVRLHPVEGLQLSLGQPVVFEVPSAGAAGASVEARVSRIADDSLALKFEHLNRVTEDGLEGVLTRQGRLMGALDQ